jgi:ribosomal protein S18 acetylase RimI-like enzyme
LLINILIFRLTLIPKKKRRLIKKRTAMKAKFYKSYLLICLISTLLSNNSYAVIIEKPADVDCLETYNLFYKVGGNEYENHWKQILSPDEKQNVYDFFESNVFQSMWHNRNIPNNYFFIAKDNGKVIGMLYATIDKENFYNKVTNKSLVLSLCEMYIMSEYQGKEIDQQLLAVVFQEAKNQNPELIIAITKELHTNIQAINCYEKAGFEAKEMVMYKKI